jgi:hypothetical protein
VVVVLALALVLVQLLVAPELALLPWRRL